MQTGLFEREGELGRIDALLALAQADSGGMLLITGPAGIGKSALLGVARERALLAGMRVLSGRGRELEGGFSFGVARQLFEPLLAHAEGMNRDVLLAGAAGRALTALEDEAGAAPPAAGGDPAFAVVHGLYWLAVNASRAAPVLMAIDDVQWADQASLRFLLYLADRLVGLPIALALTWRTGEAEEPATADCLARLEQIAAGSVVSPGGLSQEAVGALLAGAFGTAPGDRFARSCHAVTGGNPFLVRELIETLRADGIGPGDAGADQLAGLGPRSVAREVALRIARLGPTAAELARAVAILGDEASLRHAAALAGAGLADAAASADRLAGIGVFEPGTPLRFVHSLVRTAVHDEIPPAERGLRHAEAARLLAAEGTDPDVVCAHLVVCEPTGSRDVVDRLRVAAARAMRRGAPESAAAYLRRALAETADVSLRAALLHELGLAEKVLADPAAVQHLRESLELASDPVQRAAVAPDLAELLVLTGQWDEGAAFIQTALEELADADAQQDDRARAAVVVRLQTWLAGLAAYDPRLVDGFDQREGQLLAAAREDTAEQRTLAAALAGILAWRGEQAGTVLALLDHALDGGRLLTRADSHPLMVAQALIAPVWLDELTRAEALAGQLFVCARSQGSVAGLAVAACVRAAVRVRRGELVAAESDVRMVMELAAEHGVAFAVPSVLYSGADALVERAELADIAAFAAQIELDPGLARTASGALLREVRGRLALAAGDFATARTELQSAAGTYESLHLLSPSTCWRSALALALAAEDPGEALRLADSDLELAQRAGLPRPGGIALRTRGMLAAGRPGLDDLREAARILASCGARLEHARALVELGAALRRSNQRTAAREPLRRGLDLAYHCGAGRLAQRATDELRATGARPRRASLTGLEALTPSERRVAELAAGGMSNPEIAQAVFVTLNTVEGHLRHVYQKLSVTSRSQLPAALRSAVSDPAVSNGGQGGAGRDRAGSPVPGRRHPVPGPPSP
jgi:DNA-binding CsgD family transcriptional regulator/tetratricopeptide (TPR) repeat protein